MILLQVGVGVCSAVVCFVSDVVECVGQRQRQMEGAMMMVG